MVYAWEEDKSCEYLEVNEVIESTECQNWTPKQRKNLIDFDLVFSPAQVTEHCTVWSCRIVSSHRKQRTGLSN